MVERPILSTLESVVDDCFAAALVAAVFLMKLRRQAGA